MHLIPIVVAKLFTLSPHCWRSMNSAPAIEMENDRDVEKVRAARFAV